MRFGGELMYKSYKVLDLFAGAGGFSQGFKSIVDECGNRRYEIVGVVEIDKYASDTIVSSMIREGMSLEEAKEKVICDDIMEAGTKYKLYDICKEVDVIIGGPPCQSFSTIGPRAGDKAKKDKFSEDYRDNLFEHYIEIVGRYKPTFVVFENVKGILSKKNPDGEKYINIITQKFEELGYNLTSENKEVKEKYIILNAADYGVPQLRERVFIIGNRLGIDNPYPVRTHCPPEQVNDLGLLPYVTLKDAIGDLPPVLPKITATPAEKGVSLKKISLERKKEIECINKNRDNGNDNMSFNWDMFNRFLKEGTESRKQFLSFIKLKKSNRITGHIARGQQETDIKLFEGMEEGTSSKHLLKSDDPKDKELLKLIKYKMNSFEDKYKKLSWDKPCTTIFAHLQKDGNRFIHPDSSQARTLTVREAARVQSFPDDYIFEAPGLVRYKYIGNAVPPLLSMAIAKSIYECLERRKTIDLEIFKTKHSPPKAEATFSSYLVSNE